MIFCFRNFIFFIWYIGDAIAYDNEENDEHVGGPVSGLTGGDVEDDVRCWREVMCFLYVFFLLLNDVCKYLGQYGVGLVGLDVGDDIGGYDSGAVDMMIGVVPVGDVEDDIGG